MGATLAILGIAACYIGWFVHLKRREVVARTPEHIDVGIPAGRAVEIGVKASGSLLHRMARSGGRLESTSSRPAVNPIGNGAFEWRVVTKGGVLVFQGIPRSGGARVECWAEEVFLAQFGRNLTGIFALGFAVTNAFYRMIGLPRDPGGLIRRRRRVLRAVDAAEQAAVGRQVA